MHNTSSIELLTLASIDPQESECKQAFNELYKRYSQYIWNVSYNAAHNIDPTNAKGIAMELMQNTVIDFHKNAGKFQPQSDNEDKDIQLWLAGIVKYKKLQYIEENNKHKKLIVFMEVLPEVEEPKSDDNNLVIESFEHKVIRNALKTLTAKESSVLLSWYNFHTEGKVRGIDKSVKESLSKQFNVKVDSLKQIKKRALDKVLNYIKNHTKS